VSRFSVIGLTGGVASGKSTVARILRELGAPVVDADQLAREVVTRGSPALQEIVRRFGPGVLGPDGELDRPALGALVFQDARARKDLEAITHPRIAARAQQEIAAHASRGARVVIYEAALIVENRLHEGLQGLIVVAVPPEVQLARLMHRDRLDEAAARARLQAQLPLEAKVAVADHVIDNSGSLEDTRQQTLRVWQEIEQAADDEASPR
jgi:dephospho-CoA kinase